MMRKVFSYTGFLVIVLAVAGGLFAILHSAGGTIRGERAERQRAECRYKVSVAMLPYLDNARAPEVAAALYDDCLKAGAGD